MITYNDAQVEVAKRLMQDSEIAAKCLIDAIRCTDYRENNLEVMAMWKAQGLKRDDAALVIYKLAQKTSLAKKYSNMFLELISDEIALYMTGFNRHTISLEEIVHAFRFGYDLSGYTIETIKEYVHKAARERNVAKI